MKSFIVGGKVGLLVWVHIQLADCSGAFEDSRLEHVGMKSLKPSSRGCAAACVLNVDCVSFSYDLQTRICLLKNTIPGNSNMAYDKCKCHRDGCSLGLGLRCQVFQRHHPHVSESRVCGKRLRGVGAKRQVSNAVTTYTCGNRENLTSMCGLFKWINPRTNYPLFLPCGSWQEFSVTIRGTPNNNSRFDVYVNKSQDSVFYTDFRFNFKEQDHRIVCNTFIQNTWGKEITRMNHTLHIGRECIVKITLRHGVYSLDVDGERRCMIAERSRGAQPEFIIIKNDVTVHSVEFAV